VTPVEAATYLGHQTTSRTDANVDHMKEMPLLNCSTRKDCEAKSPCLCLTLSLRKCVTKTTWKVGLRVGFSTMMNAAIYCALSGHGFQAKRMTHSRPSLPTRFNAL